MSYLTARGWLTGDERQRLYDLARAVPNGSLIVNIGIEHGASMVCLHEGNPRAKLLGIDIDTSKYAGRVGEIVQADSGLYITQWDRGAVALAFIDGDHSFEGVLRDTALASFISVGGVIAFHDCIPVPGIAAQLVPGVNWAVSDWYRSVTGWKELAASGSTRVFQRVS